MLTIAWDIDDVLNELMRSWLEEWWRPANPGSTVGYADLSANPPLAPLELTEAAYLASLDGFRASAKYANLQPPPELLKWFAAHGGNFHHLALTAVPRFAASFSAAWLFAHFGDWFRGFHFVPSARPADRFPAYDKSKAAFLRRVQAADIFIDDNPQAVARVQELGVKTFLVAQPWNRGGQPLAAILAELVEEWPKK